MKFNAWTFARSFASVALAQSNDDGRPVLYRTTLLEWYPQGVRMVSTDSYLLLRAWVPNLDHDDEPEPSIEVAPDLVTTCIDRDQRVLGLMKYVQKLCKDDAEETDLALSCSVDEAGDASDGTMTLAGLQGLVVKFRMVDTYDEAIECPVFDGPFPNWRPLWDGFTWTNTGLVAFGADALARLGKLTGLWAKASIRFDLGGAVGVSRISIDAPGVNVDGLLMPVRIAGTNPDAPAEEAYAPASDEGRIHQFEQALDDWIAEVLRTEPPVEPDTDDDDPEEPPIDGEEPL